MNKTQDTLAIVLLAIGVVLSPAIYILLFGLSTDSSGISRFIEIIILPLPAFISAMCLAFGVGRLIATKHRSLSPALSQSAVEVQNVRQMKSNLLALIIGTILLGVVGLGMLLFVIHLIRQSDVFLLILPGAIPIFIVIFTAVMVPINIRHIMKQKRALNQ